MFRSPGQNGLGSVRALRDVVAAALAATRAALAPDVDSAPVSEPLSAIETVHVRPTPPAEYGDAAAMLKDAGRRLAKLEVTAATAAEVVVTESGSVMARGLTSYLSKYTEERESRIFVYDKVQEYPAWLRVG